MTTQAAREERERIVAFLRKAETEADAKMELRLPDKQRAGRWSAIACALHHCIELIERGEHRKDGHA